MLGPQVALDALWVQGTHVDGKRNAVDLAGAGLAVEQGQAGQERDLGAAGSQQLLASVLEGVRLAQDAFAEHGDLV
ncbi:hypothetical protein D3C75_1353790 [compost metagenome]